MSLKVELNEELQEQLSKAIRQLYREALEEARRDVGITKEYLTVSEAFKFINMSRNTFQNNVIDKGLPVYQIEGKTYVKKSEINEFIEKHRI